MNAPESLELLLEYGIIQEVVRPLMSGKEAHVYIVVAGGEECVAKVYKEAHQRTFKHRSDYTEGRRTRNSRDRRAMSKRTQHGRKKDEDAWRSTEVDMIYRLRDAGVRVPEPINFVEGVLVMELVKDADGHAAPRLGDLSFSPDEAKTIYQQLMRDVVRMLCAGVIHGDLSDFNVLMSHDGPVVIDFPQAVDPTHNPNSQKLLLRDVGNLHRFLARFAPDEPVLPYGEEIWKLFQANKLEPDTRLTGLYAVPKGKTNTDDVMALIEDAHRDEEKRRGGGTLDEDEDLEFSARPIVKSKPPLRRVVDFSKERGPRSARKNAGTGNRGSKSASPRRRNVGAVAPPAGPAADGRREQDGSPTSERRRRGNRRTSSPSPDRRRGESRAETETVGDVKVAGDMKPATRRRRRRSGRGGEKRNSTTKPTRQKSERNQEARAERSTTSEDRLATSASRSASSRREPKSNENAATGRPLARRRRRRPRKVSPAT